VLPNHWSVTFLAFVPSLIGINMGDYIKEDECEKEYKFDHHPMTKAQVI
jgi:hypothetical protein